MRIVAHNPNQLLAGNSNDAEAPTHQRREQEGPFVWFPDTPMHTDDLAPAGDVVLSADLILEAADRITAIRSGAAECDQLPSNMEDALIPQEEKVRRIWERNGRDRAAARDAALGLPTAPATSDTGLPGLGTAVDELLVPGVTPGTYVPADGPEEDWEDEGGQPAPDEGVLDI